MGCLNCKIRNRYIENSFETCTDCAEYEKCNMLNGFFSVPSHEEAKNNLENIRKL